MTFLTGRFGVEIELNSLDHRDFVRHPLGRGERPSGMEKLAEILSGIGLECEVQDWQYNHNPSGWSCKPDSSCGIELCSPVMDIDSRSQISAVLDSISGDFFISADDRCSVHVHVEFSDMEPSDSVASVLAWWIKCEHVFIDFADPARKNNLYCRPIGLTDLFDSCEEVSSCSILKKLSRKHLSANSFHFFNRRRPTLEFRIGEGTKDSKFVLNWSELILNFSMSACNEGLPSDYLWLEPAEVLEFMNLKGDLRDWFLMRLMKNTELGSSECFSPKNRKHAMDSYESMARKPSPFRGWEELPLPPK